MCIWRSKQMMDAMYLILGTDTECRPHVDWRKLVAWSMLVHTPCTAHSRTAIQNRRALCIVLYKDCRSNDKAHSMCAVACAHAACTNLTVMVRTTLVHGALMYRIAFLPKHYLLSAIAPPE